MRNNDFMADVMQRTEARQLAGMGFLPALEQAQMEVWAEWIADGRLVELAEWGVRNFDSAWHGAFEDQLLEALELAGRERELGRYLRARTATLRRLFFSRPLSVKDPRLSGKGLEQRLDVLRVMEQLAVHLDRSGDAAGAARVRATATDFADGRRRSRRAASDRRRIDADVFWDLVNASRSSTTSTSEQVEQLTESLSAFGARDIHRFAALLDAKMAEAFRWDLWALAYIARGGCSDDAFSDFRAWLVSRGRRDFELSLADLDHAATLVEQASDCTLEALQSIAADAYEQRCGKQMPTVRRCERRPAGLEWSEEDLPSRFPDLCRRFGFGASSRPDNS